MSDGHDARSGGASVRWTARLGIVSLPLLPAAGLGIIPAVVTLVLGPRVLRAARARGYAEGTRAGEIGRLRIGMAAAVTTLVVAAVMLGGTSLWMLLEAGA